MGNGRKLLCLLLCLCLLLTACGDKGSNGRGSLNSAEPTDSKVDTTQPATDNGTKTDKPQTTDSKEKNIKNLPIFAANPTGDEAEAEQKRFTEYLDKIFVEMADGDSLTVHFLMEHPENFGITEGKVNFGSADETGDYAEDCVGYQVELETFNYDLLTTAQKVYYDRLAYEFKLGIEAGELECPISTVFSANSGAIPNGTTYYTEYPLVEEKDVEAYIELLRAYPEFLELVKSMAAVEQEQNLYPSDAQIEDTLDYIDGLLVKEGHPFVVSFENNLKEVQSLSDSEKEDVAAEAQTIVTEEIIPALTEFRSFVVDYRTEKKEGMGKTEEGKAYYKYLLQGFLGIETDMDTFFEYLQTKESKMMKSFQAAILLDTKVYDRYENASSDLSDPTEILEDLKKKVADIFPAIGETKFTVSYLPKEIENENVLAYYLTPQVDNRSRRIIRVNGGATDDNISLYNTLSHEGYPGHLYQDAFFSETDGYHHISALLSYLGYSEGWAVYVGSKSYDWLLNDEHVAMIYNFDYNYTMLLITIIDMGVNYYGWDAMAVTEYLNDHYMDGDEYGQYFFDVVADDPGVYAPYGAGYVMVNDLFKEMTDAGYSEKDAIEAYLTVGPASFEIVKKYLDLEGKLGY